MRESQTCRCRARTEPLKESKTRRDFFRWLTGTTVVAWLGSIAYPILAFLKPPPEGELSVTSVKAAKLSELPPGQSILFKFGRGPAILIHSKTGELRAFLATCTHLDCTVQYREDWDLIWCACHNGRYDLTGRNVAGPPPRPLDELLVEVQADDILVYRADA